MVEIEPSTKPMTRKEKGFGGKVWKPSLQQNQQQRSIRVLEARCENRAFN
uniref:Uncharacterized protein n=1 Tax=Cucumis melo TaxID=3656 RepID=A0A9I9DQR6_CUCME